MSYCSILHYDIIHSTIVCYIILYDIIVYHMLLYCSGAVSAPARAPRREPGPVPQDPWSD